MSPQFLKVATGTPYDVPLQYFYPSTATDAPAIMVLPALGIGARFYRPLAEGLVRAGFPTILFEQRGHGASSVRASRQCNYGFAQWLKVDMPAAVDRVRETLDNTEVVLLGHSLGGLLAACYVGLYPAAVRRVILPACGTPWYGCFGGAMRWQIRLAGLLIPLCGMTLGYFPGHRLGLGGREARQLMADWRNLATANRFAAAGLDQDLNSCIAQWPGQVLSIGYADDAMAPAAARSSLTEKMRRANVTSRQLTSAQVGGAADHFGWVRKPAATVTMIENWLTARSRG